VAALVLDGKTGQNHSLIHSLTITLSYLKSSQMLNIYSVLVPVPVPAWLEALLCFSLYAQYGGTHSEVSQSSVCIVVVPVYRVSLTHQLTAGASSIFKHPEIFGDTPWYLK
jgi:hypothetical protein